MRLRFVSLLMPTLLNVKALKAQRCPSICALFSAAHVFDQSRSIGMRMFGLWHELPVTVLFKCPQGMSIRARMLF
jgi:hypothetical protein